MLVPINLKAMFHIYKVYQWFISFTIKVKGIISGPTSSTSVTPAKQVQVFQTVIIDVKKNYTVLQQDDLLWINTHLKFH